MKNCPKITKDEWEDFQQFFLLAQSQDPTRKMGKMFINWFPETAEIMARNSNLETLSNLHNPNDDVILYNMQSNEKAKAFIIDLVEIV